MKLRIYILLGFFAILTCIMGCIGIEDPEVTGSKLVLPEVPYDYATPVNVSFFTPYGDSIIDNDVATLGRVLFYDVKLSLNNRVSCGSCHIQASGFSDTKQWSLGFRNGNTARNTQTIVNTGTQRGFFWDLREETLDHMVLQPIANHVEMGLDDTLKMEQRIRNTEYYPPLFEKAFGDDEVTTHKIGLALAQFVKSIISVSSKFDAGVMEVGVLAISSMDFPSFTPLENLGKRMFFHRFPCSQCHAGVNLDGSLSAPMNIGLDKHYSDPGKPGIDPLTGDPLNGFFKTPSLRNIALTSPYMHDGRFKTIEEVLEFYSDDIQPHPQLSEQLRIREQGGIITQVGPNIDPKYRPLDGTTVPQQMFMSGPEKAALIAFLKTLTDYNVISDPKFSSPFVAN